MPPGIFQIYITRSLCAVLWAVAAGFLCADDASAATTAKWRAGDGSWEDAGRWEGESPGATVPVEVDGAGKVALDRGTGSAMRLDLGSRPHSDALLTVNGGTLVAAEFVRLGEEEDSHARLVINGGRICTTELGIGGMNPGEVKGKPCEAEMEVHGGLVVVKYLELGWRPGSKTRLRVVGSQAEGIIALNVIQIATQHQGTGSVCDLSFEIDERGVTPIELCNVNDAIRLPGKDSAGKCRLHVKLLSAPPGGEITLLRARKPCLGAFDGLPEGSPIRADYDGKTFEWRLTYRGGTSKADVVLTDPHIMIAEARIPYRSPHTARVALVESATIKSAWEGMFREIDRATPPMEIGTLAFPGAEGFGAYAKGGRGGKVLFVTNLNDAGPGSLRAAIDAKGPRTVVFRVGGTIELKKRLQIREPFITIAGQTAPGDGICLKGAQDTLMLLNTHDVIIRYLRVRTGYTGDKDENEGDSISVYNSQNFIIDHCSTSWGTDETLSCTQNCDRYTVQWCIIAEGLDYYGHSMGSILAGDRSTWHHNLYAHCGTRNPRFSGLCRCDFRNNVIYDWRSAAGYGDFRALNYVNNCLKPGPSTTQKPPRFITGDSYVLPGSLFASGNVIDGWPEISTDNTRGSVFALETFANAPHQFPPVDTQAAPEALNSVLEKAGADWPKRDAIDMRLVREVREGTGKVVKYEREAGEWPAYAAGEPPLDSDQDGIPDEWETAHGLNPQDSADGGQAGADGYTNLEHYLNSLPSRPSR